VTSLTFGRLEERLQEPRETQLSHDLGMVCAGIAATPGAQGTGFFQLDSADDIAALKERFPANDEPYDVYFTPEL